MPKLDHAASLISSDAAATRKATLQHLRFNRKSINTRYNALFLRRKVVSEECSPTKTAVQKTRKRVRVPSQFVRARRQRSTASASQQWEYVHKTRWNSMD